MNNKNSIFDREDFYEYKDSKGNNDRTKIRLKQIEEIGLTEVGIAEFGIKGLMSGLYIERVWNLTNEDWEETIKWINDLKNNK